MKNILLPFFFLIAALACDPDNAPDLRDRVMLERRDFILSDTSIRVKPVFIPLPAGAVQPQGWIKDWAGEAAAGITGHLDEWSPTFGMAWKGVGFEAMGANPKTGTGWPLEQCSYWLDGAVRLAYLLDDSALIRKVSDRLDMVVNGVLNGGKSFIYWQDDLNFKRSSFNNWAHSHMGRALVAWYESIKYSDNKKKQYLCRYFLIYIIMVIASNQGFTAGIPYKNVFAGKAQMSEVQRLYCAYITNMDGYAQVYYVYIPVNCKRGTAEQQTTWLKILK
ncbi:MAG: hypothetical protein LBK58_05110 [Prevotellaceae bacterium]|jgi:hypothetical protein|nr:hypothetical protein [Prevotellaceae bacterium]